MGASCLDRELGNVVSVGSHAERRKGDRVPPQPPRSRQGDVGQGPVAGCSPEGFEVGGSRIAARKRQGFPGTTRAELAKPEPGTRGISRCPGDEGH